MDLSKCVTFGELNMTDRFSVVMVDLMEYPEELLNNHLYVVTSESGSHTSYLDYIVDQWSFRTFAIASMGPDNSQLRLHDPYNQHSVSTSLQVGKLYVIQFFGVIQDYMNSYNGPVVSIQSCDLLI